MSSRRYQLLSGMLAATVSLTLTGCGSNDASSSAPAASAAPAETTTEADSSASMEPISAEEPVNSFSYIGSDETTPTDETIQGSVTAIEGDTISLTIGGNAMGTPPDMPQGENNGENGGTPPDLPSDAQSGEAGAPSETTGNADPNAVPAEPDDAQAAGESGDAAGAEDTAEAPDAADTTENAEIADTAGAHTAQSGDQSEDASQQENAKTATLVLTDESVLAKNDDEGTQVEAALSDITVGDTLSITFDEQGEITAVVIEAAQQSGMGGPGGPGGSSSAPTSYDAVNEYTEDTTVDGESISSTGTDENAVLVDDDADVILNGVTIDRTSQDSTGGDSSSFYGVGAAVLGTDGNTYVTDSEITTDAAGGAGLFAYGNGTVYASDSTITTTQDTSGGIHVAGGGTLYAWELAVKTAGESSAAIRSDRGGGTMVVDGGTYETTGAGSPAVYCTADIAVNNATLNASGSEAICMEGLNTIHLFNCDVTGDMDDLSQNDTTWNVIVYQSMSGDSEVGESTMQMIGGSLTAKNGGMFYTTNTQCNILLSDVDITSAEDSEFFLRCTGNNNQRGWGTTGANGSDCTFTADSQTMEGDVIWDSISQLDFYMKNGSTLTGAIYDDESYAGNGGDGYCNVYLSKDSTWTVTGDSTVTNLYSEGTIVDESGKTVSIVGTDGTVYVSGDSDYTITVSSYSDSADFSGAATADSWENHQVEKPEAIA